MVRLRSLPEAIAEDVIKVLPSEEDREDNQGYTHYHHPITVSHADRPEEKGLVTLAITRRTTTSPRSPGSAARQGQGSAGSTWAPWAPAQC